METIKISKKNYQHYKKFKQIMDELVIVDTVSVQISYSDFAKNVNTLVSQLNDNKMSFKGFIADIKDGEDTIDIDYEIYEKMIMASFAIKAVNILNEKSKGKMDWSQYGIAVEAIVKAYYK